MQKQGFMLKGGIVLEIKKTASAGTLESSDVMVTVGPNPEGGLKVTIDSPVLALYEEQMRKAVTDAAADTGVKDAEIALNDHGAIDCVIRARVMAALCRGAEEAYDWAKEDREA